MNLIAIEISKESMVRECSDGEMITRLIADAGTNHIQ